MKKVLFVSTIFASLLAASGLASAEEIFVSDCDSNSIAEINSGGQVLTFASTTSGKMCGPSGLAIDDNGNLYTSNNFKQSISKFSTDGTFLGAVGGSTGASRGLAFDSAGNLYVATRSGKIEELQTGGKAKVLASHLGRTYGFAIDSHGNLFVTTNKHNSITEISKTGVRSTLAFTGAPLSNPHGIAIDSAGNIFVVNSKGKNGPSIEEITDGVGRVFATAGLHMPKTLAVDKDGNVFVTDCGNNSVTEYNSAGALIHTYTGFKDPCSLVVWDDSGGDSSSNNPNIPTNPTQAPNDPPGSPTAVPEPSTYVLLFLSVVTLFLMHRRRQLAKA